MAAASTNGTTAVKANADTDQVNAEQAKAKAAAEDKVKAEQTKAEQTKTATEQAIQGAAKVAEKTTDQVEAVAEKALQGAAEVAEETTDQVEAVAEQATEMAGEASERFEVDPGRVTKTARVNSARFREVNSVLLESSKAGSRVAVDTYTRAAKSFLQLQRQLVGTVRIQWVQDAATTQIQFADDVTDAWAKAARQLLK